MSGNPRLRLVFTVCLAIAATLQLVTVNAWPAFPSPNEVTRAYQGLAVVQRGTLAIDDELSRFTPMEDVAEFAGRRFPNKAPGTLPLVVAAAWVATHATPDDPAAQLRLTLVIARVVVSGVPAALALCLLIGITARRWPRGAPLAVAALALGSPWLPASLLLFSHALTGALLLAAFGLLFDRRPTPAAAAAAGFLLSWAVTCEYPVGAAAAVLGALALPRLRLRGAALATAAGAIPLIALGAYNAACFGSPFSLSTAHETLPEFASLAAQGFYGIQLPSPTRFVELLASPARGLFVATPLAVLAFAGLGAVRRELGRPAAIAVWLAPLALTIGIAGYPNWHGGWFVGPRYILPVLPLLMVPAAAGIERVLARRAGRLAVMCAAVWGWLAVWPITAAFPFPPEAVGFPSLVVAPGWLADGVLFPSWLPHAVAAVVWLGAAAAALAVTLAACGERSPEGMLGLALALAIAAAVATSWPLPKRFSDRLALAVANDIYVGATPGALERLAGSATTPQERARALDWIARRAAASHRR